MSESMLKTRLAMDDRPVKNLEKKVSSWLAHLPNESIESAKSNCDALLIQISNYQTSIERHPLIQEANTKDITKYADIVEDTVKKEAEARDQISDLKEDLKKAQKVRDNKLEYDQVAREILKLETREAYHESIAQLQSDIDMLRREKLNKEEALSSRKRKFGEMIDIVKRLQKDIEEERARGHKTQKILMDMGRDYESSDDESIHGDDHESSPEADALGTTGNFHRFQERDNDDDDEEGEDEEGMVPDGEDGAVVFNEAN
ncbi:hypothetical protein PHYBLDRAFT_158501 [Phycomyces blakesleeanus NRRL 1555(-)]|uniref:Uncharacterized protein n=1 Tax=Phycomyces blakesleeanus (strain ATCC 8743b / DSM 1359 / FGSC 10004 / NBRC 33097 / NRRL 1555) TaxID=763407 RepID=A0A163E1U5_PHYB8|nr:hypothetical protein PHYBLDRAFT_158501 [Phycomyces blakesleeanus NRRL 1555(-)]OAD74730.1 hypothetical protein PHYBLDRAFT_158501 [Phycomyces blakesleeanus NRRL 1555(-)]|eukprot:XP_018292770.1 hypothetical protein PHYBLDRAFT_158501 [Phycomyces blakesleeanus NRRL 1555(-)]